MSRSWNTDGLKGILGLMEALEELSGGVSDVGPGVCGSAQVPQDLGVLSRSLSQ